MRSVGKVLSLDISGSSTGWSVATIGSENLQFGTIVTSASDCLAKRLTIFRGALLKLFKAHKPFIIVMEDTFVGQNPAVNKLLSKFGGVAEQLVYEFLKAPPIIVSNKTVKVFFCVKKKMLCLMWYMIYVAGDLIKPLRSIMTFQTLWLSCGIIYN